MIEIGEKRASGLHRVFDSKVVTIEGDITDCHLGDIVKTSTDMWLVIPLHYRNLPMTAHKLRRDAVDILRV